MDLIELIHRQAIPRPWSEGDKIPWNEPGFSRRMLQEHLSQEHDAASRRFEIIDRHVAWIHHTVLSGRPTRILDLGCGPGLYTSRLARLGHDCLGIDFSPASIAHARETAQADRLPCSYLQQDIRAADYGQGYGLAMLVFGEFNVFRRSEVRSILAKACQALAEGGRLLLEVHTFAAVRSIVRPRSWYSAPSGLFSDRPHLCLTESFWDDRQNAATERWYILDAMTGQVTPYAATTLAYTGQEYQSLVEECCFEDVEFHPSLAGDADQSQSDFLVIVAQRGRCHAPGIPGK